MASTARSAYLEAASSALIISSPPTAGFIQSQRPSESKTNPPKTNFLHICPSCSTTLIPGWNCTATNSKRNRNDRLAGITAAQKLVCSSCNSTLRIPATTTRSQSTTLLGHEKRKVSTAVATASSSAPPRSAVHKTSLMDASSPAPATASLLPAASHRATEPPLAGGGGGGIAKKRSRGKKSSLQDLLASRKAAAAVGSNKGSSGFGLGLGDFMK